MEGTTQVQVDPRANRTFANTLRSILRQDPDIVMVGEIRDSETAANVVQVALTGHLVLRLLHTNDARSAVHGLCDMGVAPYLLGPALRCIVGQRLVPRVCRDCAEPVESAPGMSREFGLDSAKRWDCFRRGKGCGGCRGMGAKGRMAIQEVLYVSPEMSSAIWCAAPDTEILALAAAAGYRPMLEDGLDRARRGLVTLEDVLAVARTE